MKTCYKCKRTKELTAFNKKASRKDGHHPLCRECSKQEFKEYRKTEKGLTASIYSHQRSSSVTRNMPKPNYTKEELYQWLKDQPTYKTLYTAWVNSDYDNRLTPSPDRLDDFKPYTLDNLQLLTWGENRAKNTNKGITHRRNKPVKQLTLDGAVIASYFSIAEAERVTKCHNSKITSVCKGYRNTTGGYKWMYA